MIIAILLGILAGTVTGLIPGLHINLVAILVFAVLSDYTFANSAVAAGVFIVAMSITHTFLDFIPAIFLGAPADDTALSVMPGHKLLLNGFGYGAVRLTVLGSLLGLAVTTAISPVLLVIIPVILRVALPVVPAGLLFLLFFGVMRSNIVVSTIIAVICGILGIIVLTSDVQQPLLPMLSGLFGVSALLFSVQSSIPTQSIRSITSPWKKSVVLGIFSGGLLSIFPGLGPSQAAVLGRLTNPSPRSYLVMLGTINTVSMILALLTAFSIGKSRNGSIEVVSQLIPPSLETTVLWLSVALVSAFPATILALVIARFAAQGISRVPVKAVILVVILTIVGTVFLLSGVMGTAVLATSTAIGVLALLLRVPRYNLMACLIVPISLQYLV